MAITAQSKGEARKPVPAGSYFGAIVGVYDIGTQEGGKFGPKHQVVLSFELHKKKGVIKGEDGKPLRISKFYNLSFGAKADLRKDCEKMLGRKFTEEEAKEGYDVTDLLDRACRLTVSHWEKDDGTVRDQIDAFMPLDEDDPEIKIETDSMVYELKPGEGFDEGVPEWIQAMAQKSQEWLESGGKKAKTNGNTGKATAKAGATKNDDDDLDIPF